MPDSTCCGTTSNERVSVCGLPLFTGVRGIGILGTSPFGFSRKFAYHLALARGKNPDSFRADDPLFPKIRERVRL